MTCPKEVVLAGGGVGLKGSEQFGRVFSGLLSSLGLLG